MHTLRKDQARDMKSLRKLIKTIAYKQNETIEKLDDLDKRVLKLKGLAQAKIIKNG